MLGKKNVIVLSTMHNNVKITKDQPKKPSVQTLHDHTKGGVDVVDLLSRTHSTQIKSRRWPLNALAFILDTCCSNAKIILLDNKIKLTNFEITYSLRKELVLPAIKRRYSQSNGLKIIVINKIRPVLGIDKVSARLQHESFNSTFGSFFKCNEAIVDKKYYKAEREKLSNKLKTECSKCQKLICNQTELQLVCEDCIEQPNIVIDSFISTEVHNLKNKI